jgi:hypothetical protein
MLLVYKTKIPKQRNYEDIEMFKETKYGIAVYTRDEEGIEHFQFSVQHESVEFIEVWDEDRLIYNYKGD